MIISHYRKFCADDGAQTKEFYDIGNGMCCVDCPSGLNEAGQRLMEKYGRYDYIRRFAKLELDNDGADE